MNLKEPKSEEKKMLLSDDTGEKKKNEEKSEVIKERVENIEYYQDHENLTKTLTPTKEAHPLSWWIKWVSSIILIVAMIFTANNIYPWNLFFHFVGIGGWLIVAVFWNDRALIVVNAVALAIFANGMVAFILKTYYQ